MQSWVHFMKMTKKVLVGGVEVGGGTSVKIQSMTTTKTADVEKTTAQIHALENAGCEIVRVAIADENDACAVKDVVSKIHVPLVADIHFSPKLAVTAIENGANKVRINPGNIGGEKEIKFVADCVKAHNIPVRVGSNTGSIEKEFLQKYGKNEYSLVESALYNVSVLEKFGVRDIVISVKASDVALTKRAYTLLAQKTDYPLHLGVTEAGTTEAGIVKSAVGIGSLLLNGIGDTIRVSLTDDPVKEVDAAKLILRACGLDTAFVEVVSCPTCGRCAWESMRLAEKVTAFVKPYKKRLKIAVMGCVVNGPGEAKDADLGIAGGNGSCLLFKKGEPYKKVDASQAEEEFFKEIRVLLDE
ncbi:MAG: flavodoxin-dependent (E)-4-hydroxy-3-methylbut-2-enyl-diphosphate synthase [Clostridiales bacterium]|nr:flavodoxin-dependent (E)-4-hydroxy-3-methylbut-2-enyl-diphosphate synthase [Clostridiales bacterium]